MQKVIEIDLNSKEDLLERYNNKRISKDLIEYLKVILKMILFKLFYSF